MKRLIFQVNIPIRGESNLYTFCIDSVKKYCGRHNIDHIVLKEPILKILPDMARTNRNKNGLMKEAGFLPIFEKENAFDYLGQYDQIAVIDADIYIRETAPNIFDELGDHEWAGVLERDMPLTDSHRRKIQGYSKDMFRNLNEVEWKWNNDGAEFMNMGVMVFDKSIRQHLKGNSAKQFLSRIEFKDFVDGVGYWRYSTDQVLLNYWLKKSKANVKHLDWRWNAMYRGVKDHLIPEAHFVHFFLKEQIPGKGENIGDIKRILGL